MSIVTVGIVDVPSRHDASLAAVSSALSLLSNALMAWNTLHMQRAGRD